MTVPFCVRVCTCVLRDGRRHLVSSCLSFYLIFETEPSLKLELANQVEWLVREPRNAPVSATRLHGWLSIKEKVLFTSCQVFCLFLVSMSEPGQWGRKTTRARSGG